MSLYYEKKLISGVRDVPSMTLAQYNALTNKPKLWIRTDAPEGDRGINADDIQYDSNTSVKEKIDSFAITTKNYSVTTTSNGYVQPYGAYGSGTIPQADLDTYGTPINAYCLISGAPSTSASVTTNGSIRLCTMTANTVDVSVVFVKH